MGCWGGGIVVYNFYDECARWICLDRRMNTRRRCELNSLVLLKATGCSIASSSNPTLRYVVGIDGEQGEGERVNRNEWLSAQLMEATETEKVVLRLIDTVGQMGRQLV